MKKVCSIFVVSLVVVSQAGCDKIEEIKNISTTRADVGALHIQVGQLNDRLEIMYGLQAKQKSEFEARLSILEALQKKPHSTRGSGSFPQESVSLLRKTISDCVTQVRNSAEAKAETYAKFFSEFDAFYNPANDQVQNNSIYVGGKPAVFMFNKCMVSQGFSLN